MAADQQTPSGGPFRNERGTTDRQGPAPGFRDVKDDVRRAGHEARERTRETLERGKDTAAEQAEEVADALADAADRIGERNPSLAEHAQWVSDTVARMADRLRHASVDELAGEARSMARRNPTLFLMGSVGLGVLLSRFMKASSQRPHPQTEAEGAHSAASSATTPPSTDETPGDPGDPRPIGEP